MEYGEITAGQKAAAADYKIGVVGGRIGGIVNVPPAEPEASRILKRLHEVVASAWDISGKASRASERIVGSYPEGLEGSAKDTSPNGFVEEVNRLLDQLSQAQNAAHSKLDRINSVF